MTTAGREKNIITSMKSFSKDKYKKSEVLEQLLLLQQEIVNLTFNGNHATLAELRIWDAEKHLKQLNKKCGHIADAEYERFEAGSKTLANLIQAEISGNRGEAQALKDLRSMKSKNVVLKNIELGDDEVHTELDAIVIRQGGIDIVEVKNIKKDAFIDQYGNYFRVGKYSRKDSNIGNKLNLKQGLLQEVLKKADLPDVPIRSIVVFSNDNIEIRNLSSWITTCFSTQLPVILDGRKDAPVLSEDQMKKAAQAIQKAESKRAYTIDFDVDQYKKDFAVLMAKLEDTSTDVLGYDGQSGYVCELPKTTEVPIPVSSTRSAGYSSLGLAMAAFLFPPLGLALMLRNRGRL